MFAPVRRGADGGFKKKWPNALVAAAQMGENGVPGTRHFTSPAAWHLRKKEVRNAEASATRRAYCATRGFRHGAGHGVSLPLGLSVEQPQLIREHALDLHQLDSAHVPCANAHLPLRHLEVLGE
jgi:hypothetical protein